MKSFEPIFGSDVGSQLFEIVDFGNATIIEEQVVQALENFEPRIDNIEVEVDPRPDRNEFEVTVIYDIVGQEAPTQTYSFVLEATR